MASHYWLVEGSDDECIEELILKCFQCFMHFILTLKRFCSVIRNSLSIHFELHHHLSLNCNCHHQTIYFKNFIVCSLGSCGIMDHHHHQCHYQHHHLYMTHFVMLLIMMISYPSKSSLKSLSSSIVVKCVNCDRINMKYHHRRRHYQHHHHHNNYHNYYNHHHRH